jgi:hypothetical protein
MNSAGKIDFDKHNACGLEIRQSTIELRSASYYRYYYGYYYSLQTMVGSEDSS